MNFTIKKISDELKILKIEIEYDKLIESNFTGVNSLTKSSKTEITFFHNLKYKDFLTNTKAGACFLNKKYEKLIPNTCIPIFTEKPYQAFINTLNLFFKKRISNGKISKNSNISNNSIIGTNVEIQDNVIINENVNIGENSIISSNTLIGKNVYIGSNVIIGKFDPARNVLSKRT